MSESSRAVLDAFESLSPSCQAEVTEEIMRRARAAESSLEDWLHQAADEVFSLHDDEERARATGA